MQKLLLHKLLPPSALVILIDALAGLTEAEPEVVPLRMVAMFLAEVGKKIKYMYARSGCLFGVLTQSNVKYSSNLCMHNQDIYSRIWYTAFGAAAVNKGPLTEACKKCSRVQQQILNPKIFLQSTRSVVRCNFGVGGLHWSCYLMVSRRKCYP